MRPHTASRLITSQDQDAVETNYTLDASGRFCLANLRKEDS